jgi:predicted nucleic acid-binding protein
LPGYFLDAYAMLEILKANKAYDAYLDDDLATSILHRYEVHYHLLHELGPEEAAQGVAAFRPMEVAIEEDDMLEASAFRLEHRRARLSYADALGYAMARRRGSRFLTGDEAFRTLRGVEFVK